MRFLIDADCPRALGAALAGAGHDVVDIRDRQPDAADDAIYALIQRERRILVTRDTDFGNLLRYPPTPSCGIVLLRGSLLTVGELIAMVERFLSHVTERDLMSRLAVLRVGRYRIHHP